VSSWSIRVVSWVARGSSKRVHSPLLHPNRSESSPPRLSGEEASLVLGTAGNPLWLLRSRPDQVHGTNVRGGPPKSILSASSISAPSAAINAPRTDRFG